MRLANDPFYIRSKPIEFCSQCVLTALLTSLLYSVRPLRSAVEFAYLPPRLFSKVVLPLYVTALKSQPLLYWSISHIRKNFILFRKAFKFISAFGSATPVGMTDLIKKMFFLDERRNGKMYSGNSDTRTGVA